MININSNTLNGAETLADFIKNYDIKESKVIKVSKNPNMDDPKYEANHYEFTFVIGSTESGRYAKTFTTYFSKGIGLSGKPTADEVLNCLVSDAQGVSDYSFEEWASNYGYDTDSRKAESLYKTIVEQTHEMQNWLGKSLFHELMGVELDG